MWQQEEVGIKCNQRLYHYRKVNQCCLWLYGDGLTIITAEFGPDQMNLESWSYFHDPFSMHVYNSDYVKT